MATTPVAGQTANGFNGAGTTVNVVLPNNPTKGNLVAIAAVHGNSAFNMTCADSNGNVYTPTPASPVTLSGGGAKVYNFFLKDAPANASKTITLTCSSSADLTGHAIEVSGVDTISPVSAEAVHNNATSSGTINDPTITPNNDNSFLFCGLAADALTCVAPWTAISTVVNGNWASYLIQGSKSAVAIAFTQNVNIWGALVTEFKAAAGNVLQPIYTPADDESGWMGELTQVSEWWGAGASIRGWFDADFILPPSALIQKTLNATVTTTSTMTRRTGKVLSATVASTSAIVKQVGKILSATGTTSSLLTKQARKILSATATSTSTVSASKVIQKALSATVNTTSTLIRQVGKKLSATVASTSTVRRAIAKILSATATTTSALAALKVKLVLLSATVNTSASLIKSVQKRLSASVVSSSSVVTRTIFSRILSATVTSSSLIVKQVSKRLSIVVTTTSALSKARGMVLNATVSTSADLTKRVGKRFDLIIHTNTGMFFSTFVTNLLIGPRVIFAIERIRRLFALESKRLIVIPEEKRIIFAQEAPRIIFAKEENRMIYAHLEDDTIVAEGP